MIKINHGKRLVVRKNYYKLAFHGVNDLLMGWQGLIAASRAEADVAVGVGLAAAVGDADGVVTAGVVLF